MTSSNINIFYFPCYWPFVRGNHRSHVNSPHKGQWRGDFMFSLTYARTNGWVINRDTGDLWCHRAHHYVSVIWRVLPSSFHPPESAWSIDQEPTKTDFLSPKTFLLAGATELCNCLVKITKGEWFSVGIFNWIKKTDIGKLDPCYIHEACHKVLW